MNKRNYPGKLLLFGEYTVLRGGRALAVPVSKWSGRWENGSAQDANLEHLLEVPGRKGMGKQIDLDRFTEEVDAGVHFHSDIPVGYGLGSSGALSAAVWDRFGMPADTELKTEELVEILAKIEGCFHGESSGFDPLVSSTNRGWVREQGRLVPVDVPVFDEIYPFLIDTGMQRETAPLVRQFNEMLKDDDFVQNCARPLTMHVDHAIAFYLYSEPQSFWEHLGMISRLQRQYFEAMIPTKMHAIWDLALDHTSISIKLCGAGGGGYLLGFAGIPQREVQELLGVEIVRPL